MSAAAVPPTASTASASVRVSARARRRPGRAGTGGPPRSPYGGRLASTSAWASRQGSGKASAARTGWDRAGPPAGLNDNSGSSIGRVLVTPRGEPTGAGWSIDRALEAFTSFTSWPTISDGSPEDGITAAGTSGIGPCRTGMSDTGMAGTDPREPGPAGPGSTGPGSTGPGSTGPGDPGQAGSANSAGPGPTGSGIGGPGPARSAWSPRMKSVKEPLL